MDPYEYEHRSKHHHRDREKHKHRHHHHHKRRRDSREAPEQVAPAPAPPPPPPTPLPTPAQNPQTPNKNFKLLVDPCLVKGASKRIYRYDGIVASEPSWNVSNVKDPRPKISRLWTREVLDLPVPRFKIDKNYVGDPPEVEITITNINDNIDKAFLTDLVSKYGDLEEVSIFYHPITRKHTGNARIVFTEVSSAHACVAALHKKSVMGKSLNTFIDPMGKEWMKLIQKITKPDEDKEESPTKSCVELEPPKPSEVDLKPKDTSVDTKPLDHSLSNSGLPPNTVMPEAPSQMFSVPPPAFNRPPPMPGPPTGVPPPWHPRPEWSDSSGPWSQPPPPLPAQWPAPPPFMSPPPVQPPQPTEPAPPETEKSLDLDTRIELLLKGGINGIAPPFLALDEEEAKKTKKPARSRSSSVSVEEEDEPLPPGVEVSPSYSPTAPLPSLREYTSDKYMPLSTPPSPFLSEEEYLESLLKWRLRHLSFVQQEEDEEQRKKSRVAPDKVSEISSEEDETVFAKNDDQMSLSSLSSVNENIEEVAIPLNPYGSYHAGDGGGMSYPHYPHHPPDPSMWPPYGNAYPGSAMYPPYGMNQMYPEHFDHYQSMGQEPVGQEELLNNKVDAALERVCELMAKTLERDIMKRLTEVLAFNEFEKWWEAEERKHNETKREPEKENDGGKDETEEKKSTTDALLNAIIDSNFDSAMSGFTLGFRAALPKMPSFRKKQPMPLPGHKDSQSKFDRNERNESDDEEMVKLSDSESRDDVEEMSVGRKKRLESVSSSSLSSSSEASESEDSEAESIASDTEKNAEAREEFLSLIDDEKLEELRSKTPEDRLTPLPFDDFSDVESKSSSRASSPGGSGDLKRYAMEALAALGLDEFVESVKIRDKEKHKKPALAPTTSSIVKRDKTKVAKQPIKVEVKAEPPVSIEEPVNIEKKEEEREIKEEGEITIDGDEEGAIDVMETNSPVVDLISAEHSYSRPEGEAKPAEPAKPAVDSWILDHDYTSARAPVSDNAAVKSSKKERKKKSEKLVSHLLDSYLKKEPRVTKTYAARDPLKEMMTCYEFLTKGVDQEDINYMKKAFEVLLKDETQSYWLSQMHWASHPVTDLCRAQTKRSRGHQSGCARTQGFYKLDPVEKQKLKHHYGRNKLTEAQASTEAKTWTSAGREARSHQRRLLTAFGADTDSDLLKFNQLKFRKKLLKFGKSEIHDWGLFAKEPIAADEMVIEYVGQKVRPFLADYREVKYQKRGIGSSYLFRIDLEHIVDATTCGNLARFINHSCNPNCYAKIITIESEKKIVIYSKRDIKVDEEITYDYKFPLEEEKIACLCGDAQCKGFLN